MGQARTAMVQDQERRLKETQRFAASLRVGVVTDDDPLTVDIGDSGVDIVDIPALKGPYAVDDVVLVGVRDSSPVVLGVIGDGTNPVATDLAEEAAIRYAVDQALEDSIQDEADARLAADTAIISAANATFQPLDGDLTSIAALTTTSYGRGFLDLANAAAAITYLGAISAATAASAYQPLDSDLTSIAALSTASFGRSLLTEASASSTRSTLGLGTSATLNVPSSGDAASGEVVKGNDTRLTDTRTPTDNTVSTAKLQANAVTQAKASIGTGSTQLAGGDDARFPTSGQKNALAGTAGTPGTGNEYATKQSLDLKAPLASPALTGNPTAPTPTAGDDDTSIATTAFVQDTTAALAAGLQIMPAVDYATTASIPQLISGVSADGTSASIAPVIVDGVGTTAMPINTRILVKDETGANRWLNGIWRVNQLSGTGEWFRSDADSPTNPDGHLEPGAFVSVLNGTANKGRSYYATSVTQPTTPPSWVGYLSTWTQWDMVPGVHAASHLPGGADALTTAAGSTLSGTNSAGSAASLARSDHNHAMPNADTWHAVETFGNGFTQLSVANTMYLAPVKIPSACNITGITFLSQGTTGTCKVALYDSSGVRVAHRNVASSTMTNAAQKIAFDTPAPYAALPGLYYIGITFSGANNFWASTPFRGSSAAMGSYITQSTSVAYPSTAAAVTPVMSTY